MLKLPHKHLANGNWTRFHQATIKSTNIEHLLGKEAAKDAARATDANKSYGFGNCLQHFVIVDVL